MVIDRGRQLVVLIIDDNPDVCGPPPYPRIADVGTIAAASGRLLAVAAEAVHAGGAVSGVSDAVLEGRRETADGGQIDEGDNAAAGSNGAVASEEPQPGPTSRNHIATIADTGGPYVSSLLLGVGGDRLNLLVRTYRTLRQRSLILTEVFFEQTRQSRADPV